MYVDGYVALTPCEWVAQVESGEMIALWPSIWSLIQSTIILLITAPSISCIRDIKIHIVNSDSWLLAVFSILFDSTILAKFVFPIYSQYKYKWVQESSFPEGWYTNDYDDSDWETYTVQTDVIQQKFYLFRIPFTVPYVSQSSYYDLYIRYSSGIKVYINGQDYFSNNYIEYGLFSLYYE